MSLIIISTRQRITLGELTRLSLKWIFDRDHSSLQDLHTINEQMELWFNYIMAIKNNRIDKWGKTYNDQMPIGQQGTPEDQAHFMLMIISDWLVKEEKGFWNKTKDTWKKAGIDYRDTINFDTWFPERKKNYARGEAALKKAMEDKPEDYQKEK